MKIKNDWQDKGECRKTLLLMQRVCQVKCVSLWKNGNRYFDEKEKHISPAIPVPLMRFSVFDFFDFFFYYVLIFSEQIRLS